MDSKSSSSTSSNSLSKAAASSQRRSSNQQQHSSRRAPPPPPSKQREDSDRTSSSSASSDSDSTSDSSSSILSSPRKSNVVAADSSSSPTPTRTTALKGLQEIDDVNADVFPSETERLGLRLGQEVIHLKERVQHWKGLYEHASQELSTCKALCSDLEHRVVAAEGDLESARRDNADLRVRISTEVASSAGAQAESGRIASAREEALLALVTESEHEVVRLRAVCDEKTLEIARLEASHDYVLHELRDALMTAESKHKKRVERLRERTLRHVGLIHNLKAALAESASQTAEARALHQEVASRFDAAKVRIDGLEGEIGSLSADSKKGHASLLDARSTISELRAQVVEKDRQLERESVLVAQLQSQVQDMKATCSELERDLRNVKEDKEHAKAIVDAELHRATESAARARELQRQAERDLLVAKYRAEEALAEASERHAEAQRAHNKEVMSLKAEIEDCKHALASERAAVNAVAEQASLKSSRDLTEARNASAQFIFRLESQLAAAVGKAERFERLYQQQLTTSKDVLSLEVNFASAASERNQLIEKLRLADENSRQLELRALSAEGEVEILRRRLETVETDIHRVVLAGAGSEDRHGSEQRTLSRAMDKISVQNAHLERKLEKYRFELTRLRGKYQVVKDCNSDLIRTIRDYEKLCLR